MRSSEPKPIAPPTYLERQVDAAQRNLARASEASSTGDAVFYGDQAITGLLAAILAQMIEMNERLAKIEAR